MILGKYRHCRILEKSCWRKSSRGSKLFQLSTLFSDCCTLVSSPQFFTHSLYSPRTISIPFIPKNINDSLPHTQNEPARCDRSDRSGRAATLRSLRSRSATPTRTATGSLVVALRKKTIALNIRPCLYYVFQKPKTIHTRHPPSGGARWRSLEPPLVRNNSRFCRRTKRTDTLLLWTSRRSRIHFSKKIHCPGKK